MNMQEFDCLSQLQITKKRMFKKAITFQFFNIPDLNFCFFYMV